MKNKITLEMLPAFQGVIPATIATLSQEGTPNVTYISQVFYIDESHLAISNQFFNKTWKNIQANPKFAIALTCPETSILWKLELEFIDEQKEGEVFDEMDMMIEAINSMFRNQTPFKLQSALICRILQIKNIHPNE
ncbi:pyridoxamine 5'-phosphate oxidase family protein [Gaetbulibacter sp. M235]|uniref:pyridoxamine 5'-phosphate oxidase family protein n=1 Tax=Gaetbulibacter sp. M235 TaxID=3126510 RepID=UPI00374EE8D8